MIRSITRVVSRFGVVSRRSRWFGYSGVSLLNSGRASRVLDGAAVDGVQPHQRVELLALVGLLALARGTRTAPVIASPRRRPFLRTMFIDT